MSHKLAPPPSRQEILTRLRAILPQISLRYPVRKLGLFGSFARGSAQASSDIDLLVDVDPSIGLAFVTLAEELETALKHRVDLVSRGGVKPQMLRLIEEEIIYV